MSVSVLMRTSALFACLVGWITAKATFDTVEAAESQTNNSANDHWTNICTGGKDPTLMTVKNYFAAFNAGPCSPLIALPGLMASVLRVEITDCNAFRQFDPVTFQKCGWNACDGGSSSPQKEYQIWVPYPESPMSILTNKEDNKMCFAGLVEALIDNSTNPATVKQKPGLYVTVKGFTPETIKNSDCGTSSTEDVIPDIPNPEETANFKLLIHRLKAMGYRSGLTLQAMPYDFRLATGQDTASRGLPTVLLNMKKLTNKKIVILAHSFGNLKAAYGLWSMDQADKDESVHVFLSLAPPFLGAAKPISYLTCGSNEFSFPFHLGIDMPTWIRIAGSFPSVFELAPQPSFVTQTGQTWMQRILARIAYENGTSSDPVYPWMPLRNDSCYQNFTNKSCSSGLFIMDHYASYLGLRVNNSNLHQWLYNHSFSNNTDAMWTMVDPRWETLPNINVPTVIVYASIVPTEGFFTFNQDPKITWSKGEFCSSKNMSWSPLTGDDTVPAPSAVSAALKWADDFLNGVSSAKPIKLLQVCSAKNIKGTPYDSKNATGAEVLTQVEYQGLPCDCSEGKYRHCTHTGILYNDALIDYISTTLVTGDVQPVSQMVNDMSEIQLQSYWSNCKLLSTVYSLFEPKQTPAKPVRE